MSTSDTETPSLAGEGSHLANSFKRSYDQLDVGENIAGDAPSSSAAGNDRHKRARSESRSDVASSGGEATVNITDDSGA